MDDFGVLTEQYDLKPQGKSAPMAASKRCITATTNAQTRNYGFNSGLDQNPTSYSSKSSRSPASVNGSFLDDHDMFSQSNTKQKPQNSNDDDIFGRF
ncbi:hypothetical protein SLA2020_415960 [Shorea laevis]